MGLMRIAADKAAVEDAKAEGVADPGRVAGDTDQWIDQLLKWIPGETVSIFVAAIGVAVSTTHDWVRWAIFVVALIATPIWVRIHYRTNAKTPAAKAKNPKAQMVIGSIAFIAWSMSVPGSNWTSFDGWEVWYGTLVAVLVAFAIATYVANHNSNHPDDPI